MPEVFELHVWAEGVVTDADGNVIEQEPEDTADEPEETE